MKRRKKRLKQEPWAEYEKQHKIGLKKDGNGSKLKLDQLRKLPDKRHELAVKIKEATYKLKVTVSEFLARMLFCGFLP
jgi:hypothetical protein